MLKVSAESKNGGTVLILGLEGENLRRLHAGEPIHIHAGEVGELVRHGDVVEILLFAGETEADLIEVIGPLIGPETDVFDHRHRGDPRPDLPPSDWPRR